MEDEQAFEEICSKLRFSATSRYRDMSVTALALLPLSITAAVISVVLLEISKVLLIIYAISIVIFMILDGMFIFKLTKRRLIEEEKNLKIIRTFIREHNPTITEFVCYQLARLMYDDLLEKEGI